MRTIAAGSCRMAVPQLTRSWLAMYPKRTKENANTRQQSVVAVNTNAKKKR